MMKDYREIIEDGLLEQYILGELHSSDASYIEHLLDTHKEFKAYFDSLEAAFETIGMENSIPPPDIVKQNLLARVKSENTSSPSKEDDKIKSNNNYRFYFGIAASFAIFLLASSIWLYSQLNNLKEDIITVESDKQELNEELNQLSKALESSTQLYTVLADPDTQQYVLKGNSLMPDGKVVSYVNHNLKSVIINTERLPELDTEHDYQMWADVDGEMINMGVINTSERLLAMNYINNSESLNITIEPSGGSDHPTVEKLVTNVYL